MKTKTFAEICVRQGQLPEAIAIYRALIAKSPSDASLLVRLTELEALLEAGDAAPVADETPSRPLPGPTPGVAPTLGPTAPPLLAAAAPTKAAPAPAPVAPKPAKSVPAAPTKAHGASTATAVKASLSAPVRRQVERLEKLLYRVQARRKRGASA